MKKRKRARENSPALTTARKQKWLFNERNNTFRNKDRQQIIDRPKLERSDSTMNERIFLKISRHKYYENSITVNRDRFFALRRGMMRRCDI